MFLAIAAGLVQLAGGVIGCISSGMALSARWRGRATAKEAPYVSNIFLFVGSLFFSVVGLLLTLAAFA